MAQNPPSHSNPGPSGHSCPMPVRLQVLADSPIFGALAAEDLPGVDARCTARHVERGTNVYHAGDDADSLYVVAHGALKLSRPSLDGYEVLVDVVGPGDFLGMLTALGEATLAGNWRDISAVCAHG